MIFFSQKVLRKEPGNWTFVIVTDRKELDKQIYKNFADWRKKQQARAAVRVCTEKTLDQLPRVFSGELYRAKCELTYQHVYDSYFGLGSSVYESRGGSGSA